MQKVWLMGTKNEKMYSVNGLMPAIDVHPGEILGEELKARGISQKEFAEKASMQQTHLSALIHGVRNITPAVAAKLEAALEGISGWGCKRIIIAIVKGENFVHLILLMDMVLRLIHRLSHLQIQRSLFLMPGRLPCQLLSRKKTKTCFLCCVTGLDGSINPFWRVPRC